MKLEKILNNLGSLEKNPFIKTIDSIIGNNPKNQKEIQKILMENDESGVKNLDSIVVSKIFNLIEDEFVQLIRHEFVNTSSQFDILVDILIKDGNCIMKQEWFLKLYEIQIKSLKSKLKSLNQNLDSQKSTIDERRKRDYNIYKDCVKTAFTNDLENNRESKITDDELSILLTLSNSLELSQEEVKLINYTVVPADHQDIDHIIKYLKNLGVIFYSNKLRTIYVSDEMVRVLRRVRNKEVADKFFRRVLRTFREPQINLICKKHNIDRKLSLEDKIKAIIDAGISFSHILEFDVHKEEVTISDKKSFLNDLWSNGLSKTDSLKGSTFQEKLGNIISYFEHTEKDERVGISVDGYEKLLIDLHETLPSTNQRVRNEFELQDEFVLSSSLLLDYNIKPRDILDVITPTDLSTFSKERDTRQKGDKVQNILDAYKDSENLYIENYVNIGNRDLKALKEDGIRIKEADLGLKFEEITRMIFEQLGFNVDEKLKRELSTKKDKMDILLNLGEEGLILVECKTVKESGYNKFSSVSRQLKSYKELAKNHDQNIIKTLLIAPSFSDDFINDTETAYDLNLSLITAESMLSILEAFKNSKKHKKFPHMLLMRDVLIREDRIIKAIGK